ncbi:MAG: hypothetical protein DMF93_25010, partial [Acidobacteria bacterium]
MAVSQVSPLDAAIAALVGGSHRDPFALLGPQVDENGASVVRAFYPAAERVEIRLVESGALAPMTKRDPAGLYEGRV